jgi:translation initiation factor IF-3
LALAREAGLDLVEVSPQESPPVCRIMDYGKHLYERKKKMKQASQAHAVMLKEIRLRPKTDAHDRMIKLKHAREFLAEGHKVQFTMLFRGRERFHRDIAHEVFGEINRELGDSVKLERPPAMDGKRMTMIVAPGKRTGSSGGPPPSAKPEGKPATAAGSLKPEGQAAKPTNPAPRPATPPSGPQEATAPMRQA